MKRQIACPECKGNGFIVLAKAIDDYCGIGSKMCPCCDGTGLQEADVTYADRIRAMSDEELAKFLNTAGCPCPANDCRPTCEVCIAEWLQQPAEEV